MEKTVGIDQEEENSLLVDTGTKENSKTETTDATRGTKLKQVEVQSDTSSESPSDSGEKIKLDIDQVNDN